MVPARACSSSPSNGERRNRSPSETKFRVLEEITCLVAEFLLKKFFSKLSQVYHIESGREMFELEDSTRNYMVRKSHFFGIDLGNLDLNLFFFCRDPRIVEDPRQSNSVARDRTSARSRVAGHL